MAYSEQTKYIAMHICKMESNPEEERQKSENCICQNRHAIIQTTHFWVKCLRAVNE